jgi:hypothetical protein
MLTIEEIKKLPFVFIVGKGRSGTTLLQTIFDAHPNVIVPFESRLIIHLKRKYLHVINWTNSVVDEFIADLYMESEFKNFWNVDRDSLKQAIYSYPLNSLTFSILCKIVYLSYPSPFPKEKILLIGNKKPLYGLFLDDLIQIFPEIIFIHLIRDYRDNIISSRKVLGQKNIAVSAQRWVMHNNMIEAFKVNCREKFFTLKYEDLATKPEKYIRELCHFLSIPYVKAMHDFHYKTSDLYEKKKHENQRLNKVMNRLHENLMKPINTIQIDKWKEEMSLEEIEISDYIAGNLGEKYNYIRTTNKKKLKYFFISTRAYCSTKLIFFLNIFWYNLRPFWRKKI